MTLKGAFGDPITERDIASAKRINLIALLVLMLMFVLTGMFYYQLQEKKRELEQKTKELEQKTQELADSTAWLERTRKELIASQTQLAQREQHVEEQLQELSSSVEQKKFTEAVALANKINVQLAAKQSKPKVWVNFYSWQPDIKAQSISRDYLRNEQYTVVKDETFKEKPNWMGASSAVYYFDKGGKLMAADIAARLSKLCGTPFQVEEGKRADSLASSDYSWLNIHYIGKQEAKAQ
jgi:hypothetical protein